MATHKKKLYNIRLDNLLTTNAKRHRNNLAHTTTCVRCGVLSKDGNHVLRRCPGSAWVWSQFARSIVSVPVTASLRYWLFSQLQVDSQTLFCAIIWNIWKWRNSFVFDQSPLQPGEVMRRIHHDVGEFHRWGRAKIQTMPVEDQDGDMVLLHTDGSWLPGIDKMGIGGVLRDSNGRWISGFAAALGAGDAFKSELMAIQRGLIHTWELGFRHVQCYVDCLEVHQALTSVVDVQNYWISDVILATRALLARAWTVTVTHIPREMNKIADALARIGVDETWTWKEWKISPSVVVPPLCQM